MKSLRWIRLKPFLCSALILLLMNVVPTRAATVDTAEKNRLIFVLDASHSMTQERWREAVDGVAMIAAMLPRDYEVAVLAYNEDVILYTEFGQPLAEQLELLRAVKTAGYTNTGLALQTALERFDTKGAGQGRIVLISDGEISMKRQQDTESAVDLYKDAVGYAQKKNIVIDMLLFDPDGFEEQIAWGAETTGGRIYKRTDKEPVVRFSKKYLFEQLGIGWLSVGTSDSAMGETGITLQDTAADKVRILMIAESAIEDVQVSCQSKTMLTTTGSNFVVIELDKPLDKTINLRYTLTEQARADIYLFQEYIISVDAETVYPPGGFDSQITVSVKNAEGKNLLEASDVGEKIDIYIEDVRVDYAVEQGLAVIPYSVEASREVEVRVGLERLEGRVFCDTCVNRVWIEKPYEEAEEEENPYILIYGVIMGICFIFALSLVLLVKAKKKTQDEPNPESGVSEKPKYDFSGQLVIYMLKNPMGEDVPPASVNLYLRESREAFSFAWVKDNCRLNMPLTDADKILFQGGAEHTLCVKNKGNATMVCGKEILVWNRKCILHYNEKLLLIFNDGETEVEIHYKNMKPSERKR